MVILLGLRDGKGCGHVSHLKVVSRCSYPDSRSEISLWLLVVSRGGEAKLSSAQLKRQGWLAIVGERIALLGVVVNATEKLDAVFAIVDAITIGFYLIGSETMST